MLQRQIFFFFVVLYSLNEKKYTSDYKPAHNFCTYYCVCRFICNSITSPHTVVEKSFLTPLKCAQFQ